MTDILVFTDSDGNQIAIEKSDASVGDSVIIHEVSTDNYITTGKSDFSVGDEVLVIELENGSHALLKNGVATYDEDCVILTTEYWLRVANYTGEEVIIGTFNYNWSGIGQVYINNTCGALVDGRYCENLLIATTSLGSVNQYYKYVSPPLELTPIMHKGLNSIELKVKNQGSVRIGCSGPWYLKVVGV